jgi:hypothetical protein
LEEQLPEPPALSPTSLPAESPEERDFSTPLALHDTPEAVNTDLSALKKTFSHFMQAKRGGWRRATAFPRSLHPPAPRGGLARSELRGLELHDRVIRLENPDRVFKHVDGDYDPPKPQSRSANGSLKTARRTMPGACA